MKKIRSATGIRRKILYGFVILGGLLFFSGLVSVFELTRMTRITRDLLSHNVRDVELSKVMLDAVQEQNTALLQLVIGDPDEVPRADSILRAGRTMFDEAFSEAAGLYDDDTGRLDEVSIARDNYNLIVAQIYVDTVATDHIDWFTDVYKNSYSDLTLAIKNFMVRNQQAIGGDTDRLKSNAYRAIMPGIITLCVAIILIVVFFGLIDFYYIRPLVKIHKGLAAYLKSRIPYKVKVEGKDEVHQLSDQIGELTSMVRKKE